MNKLPKKNSFMSIESWMFLILTILSLTVFFKYVNLTPHVDNDFFFSSNDPNYKADAKISDLFARKDSQLIISVTGDIYSADYQKKIAYLTEIISEFKSVTSVKSLTSGPKNVQEAVESPLWRRALLVDNLESSNIIVILDDRQSSELIPKIENLISVMHAPDFYIRVSGFPYIVELIRRNLLIDLNIFSTIAFIVFSLVIVMIFHSWRILLGMVITCANAGALAFMINQLSGFKVGILTANLGTIIFVLTLSHIVFLTFNWKHQYHPKSQHDRHSAVKSALALTCPASFWSMFTTFLGFLSLIFVPAKPLRELGVCGSIGTVVAFLAAYGIYPAFLRLKQLSYNWSEKQLDSFYHKTFRFFDKNYSLFVVGIMGIILFATPRLWNLNTDPSLLSFFDSKSEISHGLTYIDHNGGSSPLVVVIKDIQGQTLNTNKMFKRLWDLQSALEQHSDVGTIVSLPTLIAEGKRRPLGFLVSSENLLQRMGKDRYDRIAESFVTPDRKHGLFLIRMKEQGRSTYRLEVIKQIKQIIKQHQFIPYLTGGIYSLQGHFSKHTASSLIYGLARLILIFTLIAFFVSHSLRIGIAMIFSISLIPVCILGMIGYFKVPLDMISAPAANIAISMGIDAMIHITYAYRRIAVKGRHHYDDWLKVRRKMWEPVITSMFIIAAGFGIFFFSSFPPTQRFGGSIVFGSIISATTALFIFPLLAKRSR